MANQHQEQQEKLQLSQGQQSQQQLQHKVRVYEDNDRFWDLLWHKIDEAEHCVCIATYDMDHKTVSGITLQKMTNAARRGVAVYLVIDDLNYYPEKELVAALEAAGGVCIRNNPFANWRMHFFGGRISQFFQRNHQKVKLVDDCQFIGSLNVADAYTGVRYGNASFRDLNVLVQGHPTKRARDFFRDMLLRNVVHHPAKLDEGKIKARFDRLDSVFATLDSSVDEDATITTECNLLQEQPPNKTDISKKVLEMIKTAESKIRIVQPYVQNIDELEDQLIEAMQKRGVSVDIVTARNRDQPCYKTHLNSYLFDRLRQSGATVTEEPFKYLHMKAVEIDDGRVMTIGSFNQDHWSFYCNNEANMFIERKGQSAAASHCVDLKAHRQFMQVFNKLKAECRPVDFNESFSPAGYIENTFWQLVLNVSHLVANNRGKSDR